MVKGRLGARIVREVGQEPREPAGDGCRKSALSPALLQMQGCEETRQIDKPKAQRFAIHLV